MTTTPYSAESAAELALKNGAAFMGDADHMTMHISTLAAIINAALSQQAAPGVAGERHPKHDEAFEGAFQELAKKIWHCEPVTIGHNYKLIHDTAKLTFDAGYMLGRQDASQPHPTGDTQRDELLLIESVLKGFPDGMAKSDGLRSVRKLLNSSVVSD